MFSPERNRSYLLPKGCKDLADVLKTEAAAKTKRRKRKPLATNQEIRGVLQKYIPELANGTLEVVSMARIVGKRCLIVVRPARPAAPKDSAGRMFSLGRGPELNSLIEELGGEFPSISRWNESTEEFLRHSFLSPELQLTINSTEKSATVTLSDRIFNQIHGAAPKIQRDSLRRLHSEMTQLVSEVTGFKISLEPAV